MNDKYLFCDNKFKYIHVNKISLNIYVRTYIYNHDY